MVLQGTIIIIVTIVMLTFAKLCSPYNIRKLGEGQYSEVFSVEKAGIETAMKVIIYVAC